MKNKFLIYSVIIILPLFSFAKSKSTEKFQKPIKKYLDKIKSCREKANSDSLTSGKVVVDLEINDNGALQRIKINDELTTVSDLNVQMCIIKTMKEINFPKAAKGQTVSFSYPVIFK